MFRIAAPTINKAAADIITADAANKIVAPINVNVAPTTKYPPDITDRIAAGNNNVIETKDKIAAGTITEAAKNNKLAATKNTVDATLNIKAPANKATAPISKTAEAAISTTEPIAILTALATNNMPDTTAINDAAINIIMLFNIIIEANSRLVAAPSNRMDANK